MYFETSYPVRPGGVATYTSNPIKAHTHTEKCLKFAYHMYGADMGQLRLHKVGHNGITTLFSNSKSERRWKEFEVTLPESDKAYVVSGIFQNYFKKHCCRTTICRYLVIAICIRSTETCKIGII